MPMVCQQYQASGNSIKSFCRSFEYFLHQALEAGPLLINSHSGTDAFSLDDQLRIIDTAAVFAEKYNVLVSHETHRGRIGFSPENLKTLMKLRPDMSVTADFSHWVCVTESHLEKHEEALSMAIDRTTHIHARVGHTQGPQVPDPRWPGWQAETEFFLNIWQRILEQKLKSGRAMISITPEFGPAPYMWTDRNNKPVADQWELNTYMMTILRERFALLSKGNLLSILLCLFSFFTQAQLKEPFQLLHGGRFQSLPTTHSPDPILGYTWDNPRADDSLQIYKLFPKEQLFLPSGNFTKEESVITVSGKGDIQFDFGQVNAAWVEFESDDLQGEVLVSISEYNEPAILNKGAEHPVKTLAPKRYGNTYRLELNDQLYEGVRFAWVHVKTFDKPWQLRNFRLLCQIKPVNYLGSFHSSDTMLNRIWYTGAYVVKLNLLQDFLGAILMERSDRHSWTGDAYPSQAAALVAFGNFDFVRKNIAFTAPQDNGIAAYSIYWVLGLLDYYQYTGDIDFLKAYMRNAEMRLEIAYKHFDTLPDLAFTGWDERLGAGFEQPNVPECQQAYRWLCINAWLKFSRAMQSIGEIDLAKKIGDYGRSKSQKLISDEPTMKRHGVHALAEVLNAEQTKSSLVQQLAHTRFGNRNDRLSYSPFNQYFILQAMALAGYHSEAITTIRDQWGGQIEYGGTTFFEVFRPSWNDALKPNSAPINNQCGYTSLAHPWGAGVVRWLSEEVLGIRSILPGFKTFTVHPHLGGSVTSVKGMVPTPMGIISASFNTVTGDCEIVVPPGSLAEKTGIPKAGKNIRKIILDGVAVKADSEDQDYIYLQSLSSGTHRINISYGKKMSRDKQPADLLQYAITAFDADSTTSGSWKNRYGKDGYFLPGYRKEDNRLSKPAYIDSLVIVREINQLWETSTADPRALEPVASESRRATAFITQDPVATLQTFPIDIYSRTGKSYYLTFYFLDWDRQGRRSSIEVFDVHDMSLMAPVQVIGNSENGKYLRFKVDRSVRIRVNHVRGPNAAVSGIFFDSL